MPPLEEALDRGLVALGLDVPVERRTTLLGYLALLAKWNRVHNLTAVRDPGEMMSHHLLDSLAALPAARRHLMSLPSAERSVLDVGSGGGLPGVVWAIAEPSWSVSCVDAVGKKAGFIRQVSAELGLPQLQAVHSRVEALPPGRLWPLITSRAFASLADFTRLTASKLAPGGVWLALKGRHPADEIAALPPDVQVFHVERLEVPGLQAERCLVWMRRAEGGE